MKYMGSKSRIAKYIVPIIQNELDTNSYRGYIEPFAGGMNVIDKINHAVKIATDRNKYLIALFKHLTSGGELYESVDKDLYDRARACWRQELNDFEDWQLGNIGFLASYNGRWFDGGFAKAGYEKTKNGERYRDYYRESSDNIMKQIDNLQDVKFGCVDYQRYLSKDVKGYLFYCDPPYQGTKQYDNSIGFDHDEFWDNMRTLSVNNKVLISEQNAPDDFKVVWEKPVSRSINAKNKIVNTEKLFVWNG